MMVMIVNSIVRNITENRWMYVSKGGTVQFRFELNTGDEINFVRDNRYTNIISMFGNFNSTPMTINEFHRWFTYMNGHKDLQVCDDH